MEKKKTTSISSGKSTMANPIEVCRNLEMCRKDIIAISAATTLPFGPEDVISSLEDAIVDFAIILGNDQPEAIHSILDDIGFTGVRSFDEEF